MGLQVCAAVAGMFLFSFSEMGLLGVWCEVSALDVLLNQAI